MSGDVRQTKIWTIFEAKAEAADQARVQKLVGHSEAVLDRIVETFPTYTLHNSTHALNVVRNMDQLLGDRVEQLMGLEAAMLLLTAYWHDVGMYHLPNELEGVAAEDDFEEFLRQHSQAYVDFQRAGGEPRRDLIEWYCRWNHADRIYRFLDEPLAAEQLDWGAIPLREKLGEVCRSHNRDLNFLKDDAIFETNFIQECDVRFCAIILRLADILDFDRSRSPEFIYHHLGFAHGDSERLHQSNAEWQKHRAAQGFIFPASRDAPYQLPFVASPDDPTVEHDMRSFLSTIDGELTGCAALLRSCSDRWRDLPLPAQIAPDFRSRGYKFGNYRFELDRGQVLSLFMGENLYASRHVFLRELLQNAIDTTRHRAFFERSRTGHEFAPEPIEVSEWLDEESRRWVRIDDYGMGMNEQLVRDYFLSVGRSYYRSPDFTAELLRYASEEGDAFTPISRFGIGVLSCFIAGDRVEVSTRRARLDEPETPLRLSLKGLESFYVLQTGTMQADPMPSRRGPEPGYRKEAGTSVAVRLDPTKDTGDDLAAILGRLLLASPVPITHHGEPVPEASEDLVAEPWFEETGTVEIELAGTETDFSADQPRENEFVERCSVTAVSLDLTAVSPDPRFRGQMAVLACMADSPDHGNLVLSGTVKSGRWMLTSMGPAERVQTVDLADLFMGRLGAIAKRALRDGIAWSHNGITLPDQLAVKIVEDEGTIEANLPMSALFDEGFTGQFLRSRARLVAIQLVGCLAFSDELKIPLSASRDVARDLPWHVRSLIQLVLLRAFAAAGHAATNAYLLEYPLGIQMSVSSEAPSLGTILDDSLLLAPDGWMAWPVFSWEAGMSPTLHQLPRVHRTLADVRSILDRDHLLTLELPSFADIALKSDTGFDRLLAAGLARTKLAIEWAPSQLNDGKWAYVATAAEPLPVADAERIMPPLYLVPYRDNNALRTQQGPLNRGHPLSQWLLDAAVPLRTQHPGMLAVLLRDLAVEYLKAPAIFEDCLDRINTTLERLRGLDFEPKPPRDLRMSPKDFV